MDKARIASISSKIGDKYSSGTAYLVTDKLLLTARHAVLENDQPPPSSIEVKFPLTEPTHNNWFKTIICWESQETDTLLLEINDGLYTPNSISKLKFGYLDLSNNSNMRSVASSFCGFPSALREEDVRNSLAFEGSINLYSRPDQGLFFQVEKPSPPNNPEGWKGVSGAAVFVEGYLVGVVTDTFEQYKSILKVSPIKSLFKDETFKKHIPSKQLFQVSLSKNSFNHPEIDLDFLKTKTQFFVDRRNVFDEVDSFIANNDSGHLLIQAEGGMGKTAVAAKLVLERKNYFCHFINWELPPGDSYPGYIKGFAKSSVKNFLTTICQQLQEYYKNTTVLPSDPEQLEALFKNLLKKKEPEAKFVFVIDGLDEVDNIDEFFRFLPSQPYSGIYFILTARPTVAFPEKIKLTKIIHLTILTNGNIREMLQKAEYVKEHSDGFIESIQKITEGHPLYLYHVIRDIIDSKDKVEEYLTSLPKEAHKNIKAYYSWQFDRLESQIAKDILWFLSLMYSPVTREQLIYILKIKSTKFDENFLKIVRFLQPQDGDKYSLYHRDFQEIVREKFNEKIVKEERKQYFQKIIEYCAKWQENLIAEQEQENHYIYNYYTRHLYEFGERFGDYKHFFALFQNLTFLEAKIKFFNRHSEILTDIELGIAAATKKTQWLDLLWYEILLGEIRSINSFKGSHGILLLSAVEGHVDKALKEVLEIPSEEEKYLQYCLIAEWLLRSNDPQQTRKGIELCEQIFELWTKTSPWLSYTSESEIIDFVVEVVFNKDKEIAWSFPKIIKTPYSSKEFEFLLTMAHLHKEKIFESLNPELDWKENIIQKFFEPSRWIYYNSTHKSYNETYSILTQCAIEDEEFLNLIQKLLNICSVDPDKIDSLHLLKPKEKFSIDEKREILFLLREIWQCWQKYRINKFQTHPSTEQEIANNISKQKWFEEGYKIIRHYIPYLEPGNAKKIRSKLTPTSLHNHVILDRTRLCLVEHLTRLYSNKKWKEAKELAENISEPFFRGLALSHIVKVLKNDKETAAKLAEEILETIKTSDEYPRNLLPLYSDNIVYSLLSVIVTANQDLDLSSLINKYFSYYEERLASIKIAIIKQNLHLIGNEFDFVTFRIEFYASDDESLGYIFACLSELIDIDQKKVFFLYKKILKNSEAKSDLNSALMTTHGITYERFVDCTKRLIKSANPEQIEELYIIIEKVENVLAKNWLRTSVSKRYSELLKVDPKAIEKVDFITNKIVDEANKIFKEPFTNELLRGFGSIIVDLYSFVPEKAKILFDCLLASIPLSSWETLQATSSVVKCCFNLASIAAGINENDKQESFLRLGNQKAKQIDSWQYSSDLYWACRSLVKIPSPEIMDGLLTMLKSVQKISPPSTNEYKEALAQVTTFYIEGLLSTTSDPESEMMKINNVLKNLQNFLEDSLK